MIRVLLNGSEGRMGKAIIKVVSDTEGMEIVAFCDAEKGVDTVSNDVAQNISVVLDITSPEGFRKSLAWAVENNKPFVSGTTGLDGNDKDLLRKAGEKIAVLHASNLSRGVNILFEVLKKISPMIEDADVEIIEMHHNKKKDAPSGTALSLGEVIKENQVSRKLTDVKSRDGIVGERSENEIGYSSIRCGDVPGEHTVVFGFEGERIEITHRALTRDIFVHGAVSAARFMSGRSVGVYSMKDAVSQD